LAFVRHVPLALAVRAFLEGRALSARSPASVGAAFPAGAIGEALLPAFSGELARGVLRRGILAACVVLAIPSAIAVARAARNQVRPGTAVRTAHQSISIAARCPREPFADFEALAGGAFALARAGSAVVAAIVRPALDPLARRLGAGMALEVGTTHHARVAWPAPSSASVRPASAADVAPRYATRALTADTSGRTRSAFRPAPIGAALLAITIRAVRTPELAFLLGQPQGVVRRGTGRTTVEAVVVWARSTVLRPQQALDVVLGEYEGALSLTTRQQSLAVIRRQCATVRVVGSATANVGRNPGTAGIALPFDAELVPGTVTAISATASRTALEPEALPCTVHTANPLVAERPDFTLSSVVLASTC
jgi:hypothetical protein